MAQTKWNTNFDHLSDTNNCIHSELMELHQTVIQQKLCLTKKTVLQTAPHVEDTIPTKSVATLCTLRCCGNMNFFSIRDASNEIQVLTFMDITYNSYIQ
jgi:hypothetical protein